MKYTGRWASFKKVCACVFLVYVGLEHWGLRHLGIALITLPKGMNHSLQQCVSVCVKNLAPGVSNVCGMICSLRGLEGDEDVPLLTESLTGSPHKSICCAVTHTQSDLQWFIWNTHYFGMYKRRDFCEGQYVWGCFCWCTETILAEQI